MNLVFEYDSDAIGGTVYYYGINRTHSSEGEFYQYNGHGDVVQLTDSIGTIVQHYEYDAFGNEVDPSASDTNPFRYCGEYFDTESGTIYLRARYYDPAIGRFTQQDAWGYGDPGDPLSLNLYVYCYANPIRYIDPLGNTAIAVGSSYLLFTGIKKSIIDPLNKIITDFYKIGVGFGNWVEDVINKNDIIYKVFLSSKYEKYTDFRTLFHPDIDKDSDDKGDHPEYHHVVPQYHSLAQEARNIMEKYGISINDPLNFVVLPQKYHSSIHTDDYLNYVNKKIVNAEFLKFDSDKNSKLGDIIYTMNRNNIYTALVELQVTVYVFAAHPLLAPWNLW